MKKLKFLLSSMMVFVMGLFNIMPSMVSATTTITQDNKIVNTTTSETLTFDEREHNSTIYAGEIKKDGVTVLNYLYSDDVTRSSVLFDNVRKALSNPYSDMVPSIIEEQTTDGLHEISTQILNGVDLTTITSGWTNASNIATQIYNGTNTDIVNSNMYDVDNAFKTEVDANETDRASIDNSIENNKSIISHLGTQTHDGVSFSVVEGDLIEVHNVDLTYLSEATTVIYTSANVVTTPVITNEKINEINVDVTANEVGTKIVDENTKPIITLDDNSNYDVSWTMYIDNLPSKDASYDSGAIFGTTIEEDNDYYVEIYLTAEEGYVFDDTDNITLKVNGGTDYELGDCSENQISIFTKVKAPTNKSNEEEKQEEYTINSSTNSGDSISFTALEGTVYSFYIKDRKDTTDEELKQIVDLMDEPKYTFESLKAQLNKLIGYGKSVAGDGTLLKLYEMYLYDNGVEIHKVDSGFKLKIKMTDDMKGYDSYKLIYIAEDGTSEKAIELTKNGEYLEGKLPHLSMYALVGNKTTTTDTKATSTETQTKTTKNPSTGDGLTTIIMLLALSIVGLIITGGYRLKKNFVKID